ncbi:TetR/AcrR family transcriptional regulator [Devosia chinhatensis]|uniref:HTH tetR-type domain-containing protein n=1 Tax=Devosia chinhatensis TaxID=429727 RepID=A0A0F5FMF6_9HYPH|nr:TetR/AcrR family transcriptional regulator [Devosia chinhatensis]KKB10049.1 hypothetical protein VE26_09700 [Devosia chinhatensis]
MGIREAKRQETARRITQSAMALFAEQGFEATTLDAIAAAAGISRRSFFHYFRSKDDILLSQQAGLGEQLVSALSDQPDGASPLDTLFAAMRGIAASYSLEQMRAIDAMMMSIESVQARKQANYIRDEKIVLEALRSRWPMEDDMQLRLAALFAIGVTRLSLDAWRSDGGTRPIVDYADMAFLALRGLSAKK